MVKFLNALLILSLSVSAFAQLEVSEPDANASTEIVVAEPTEQAVPTTQDETCDEKLQKHLNELLEKDHNGILALHYHLTMLKLAKKVNGSGQKSLEDYIQSQARRLAQLNTQDPATLTKLHSLYNGQASVHVQSVYNNINSMRVNAPNLDFIAANKIDNDDVASYILFETMQNQSSDFTKTDVAISWLMKNLRAKASRSRNAAAIDFSNQIARYTGLVKGIDKASNGEINNEMNGIKRRIDAFMADAKKDVMAANPQCANDGLWAGECTPEQENSGVAALMLDMNDVSATVANRVAANAAARTRGKATVSVGNEDRTNSCGGQFFKPKELSNVRWEFGKPDTHHAFEGIATGMMHGEIAFGPMRCKKHTKKFLVQYDQIEKEICCKDKVTQYKENKALIGLETDLGCRAFFGVAYIGELGIKGGVALEAGVGGKIGLNPQTCNAKGCIYGKGVVRPYLAIYAELLAGLGSIEGGVRWEPQLTAGVCYETKLKPSIELTPNSVYVYYTGKAGWGLVERTGSKKIYENKSVIKIL